jgi:hypothetical protein
MHNRVIFGIALRYLNPSISRKRESVKFDLGFLEASVNHQSTIDWQTVRSFDLAAYVTSRLGAPVNKTGSNLFWHSPWRSEKTPSFTVNTRTNRWTDFGGGDSAQGCSIIDYIQMEEIGRISAEPKDILRAYEVLTGEQVVNGKHVKKNDKAAPPLHRAPDDEPVANPPTMSDAMGYHALKNEALPYFLRRHISEMTVDNRLFGAFHKPWAYQMGNGEWLRHNTTRYTIPWIVGNEVRGINMRLDYEDALVQLHMLDPETIFDIRMEMAVNATQASKGETFYTPDHFTDKDVIEVLFGPKYLKQKGSKGAVFNVNRLLQTKEDGSLVSIDNRPALLAMSYCLIFEAELCSSAIEDAGFPAVGVHYKDGVNLAYAFSKVAMPLIVQDNDEAGHRKAQKIREAIGRGEIIKPLDGYKDGNDMVIDGVIYKWAAQHRITPWLTIRSKIGETA